MQPRVEPPRAHCARGAQIYRRNVCHPVLGSEYQRPHRPHYDDKQHSGLFLPEPHYRKRHPAHARQGLQAEGLELLSEAKKKTGLPIVTEIMSVVDLPLFEDVDVLQVGARNMQNFDLLRELGKLRKPILLKRGLANTLKELLMSAEYIMASGNEQVILCERGIRTFDDYTRNTLDLAAVPMLHELTHLPVIVDPSHATGINRLVAPIAMPTASSLRSTTIPSTPCATVRSLCGLSSLTF